MRLLAAAWVCVLVGGEAKQPATSAEQLAFATSDEVGFSPMPKPEPGDWLARFREPGQGFERYVRTQPVKAAKGDVLAFLPAGPFSKEERAVLDLTVEFAGLWFGLPTKVLDPRPLPKKGWQREHFGRRQYRTPYFLRNLLPDHMPPDAVCLFGVTMADLYPEDDWNFVFGQASLRGRVGVWSFARYFNRFSGRKETPDSKRQALRRALQLVVHEAGHSFSMPHCIRHTCVMNGSNSLAESDRQPLRLCPNCLKKLQWNRRFGVLERYERLRTFLAKHGLVAEARWIVERVKRIRASTGATSRSGTARSGR